MFTRKAVCGYQHCIHKKYPKNIASESALKSSSSDATSAEITFRADSIAIIFVFVLRF